MVHGQFKPGETGDDIIAAIREHELEHLRAVANCINAHNGEFTLIEDGAGDELYWIVTFPSVDISVKAAQELEDLSVTVRSTTEPNKLIAFVQGRPGEIIRFSHLYLRERIQEISKTPEPKQD